MSFEGKPRIVDRGTLPSPGLIHDGFEAWRSRQTKGYLDKHRNFEIFIFHWLFHRFFWNIFGGKTEKTTGINRSRGVRFHSAQELYLTPSRRKVLDVWKFTIFPQNLARSDNPWLSRATTLSEPVNCKAKSKAKSSLQWRSWTNWNFSSLWSHFFAKSLHDKNYSSFVRHRNHFGSFL